MSFEGVKDFLGVEYTLPVASCCKCLISGHRAKRCACGKLHLLQVKQEEPALSEGTIWKEAATLGRPRHECWHAAEPEARSTVCSHNMSFTSENRAIRALLFPACSVRDVLPTGLSFYTLFGFTKIVCVFCCACPGCIISIYHFTLREILGLTKEVDVPKYFDNTAFHKSWVQRRIDTPIAKLISEALSWMKVVDSPQIMHNAMQKRFVCSISRCVPFYR